MNEVTGEVAHSAIAAQWVELYAQTRL